MTMVLRDFPSPDELYGQRFDHVLSYIEERLRKTFHPIYVCIPVMELIRDAAFLEVKDLKVIAKHLGRAGWYTEIITHDLETSVMLVVSEKPIKR